MRTKTVEQPSVPAPIQAGLARLRQEVQAEPDFPAAVIAEAEAAASGVVLPDADRTDLPFVTIDPPGSTDLDQAVFIERAGSGYTVCYAIADVGGFVRPGGALDAECWRRGETLYAPDGRTPLHPRVLSEGAASLLPGVVRPALLWRIELDADGAPGAVHLSRARVRSREQLTYQGVQASLDAGNASEVLQLLREVGRLRQQQEVARGGVSLEVPEQEIVADGSGWRLEFRQTLPVEEWNAQISLLTGMAAAKIMREAGVGVLRTLPPARQADLDYLRHVARGLKLAWPGSVTYPQFIRSMDPAVPAQAALLTAATRMFKGAGYEAFDGTPPEQPLHAALAAEYAHVTAPLRRLVDRYGSEVCLAACAGREAPGWVREALPRLPEAMAASDARSKKYERGIVDLVEALVLAPRVGEVLEGVVTMIDRRGVGIVQLAEPAVEARFQGKAELGAEVRVRLTKSDLDAGAVTLELVG